MKFLIIFFLLILNPSVQSQDTVSAEKKVIYDQNTNLETAPFSEEKIKNLKKDPDFNYLQKIENDSWWTRFKTWINSKISEFFEWLFGDYTGGSFLKFVIKIIPYLFLGAIIGLIIWLFIRLNPGKSLFGETQHGEVYLNEEEKLVRSENLQELIQKAIQNGEFRLAVRYHYLMLLKNLNEKELISYAFQKTNSDYLSEISNENLKFQVKKLLRIYDFIWYGDFHITSSEFQQAGEQFSSVQSSINSAFHE